MKTLKTLLLTTLAAVSLSAAQTAEDGFQALFDGKSFDGWKIAGDAASFSIKDGMIVAKGEPAHAFYSGPVNGAEFKNFELRLEVMTQPNSNGGVYFGTEFQEKGWPAKGYEIQVNNTHKDPKKTGGLYAVVDNAKPFEDGTWMQYVIRVENGKITSSVNGKVLVDAYMPEEGKNKIVPGGGTIALQAHDPDSTIFYKNIRIKPLE